MCESANMELERRQKSRKKFISGEQLKWELDQGIYHILLEEIQKKVSKGKMAWIAQFSGMDAEDHADNAVSESPSHHPPEPTQSPFEDAEP